MYTLHSIAGNERHPVLSYVFSTLGVDALVAYFSYARSLNSARALYITWLSIATYLAWWGCTIYAHVNGMLDEGRQGWMGSGSIWQGLATITFAFGSSSTLPLYSSLKSGMTREVVTGKSPRSHSCRILSFFSVASAVLLILSSVIFAAFPNKSATFRHPLQESLLNSTATASSSFLVSTTSPGAPVTLNATNVPVLASVPSLSLPLPAEIALPSIQIEAARRALASITVLLGVPPLIITTPPIAVSALRSVTFNVSRVVTTLVILIVALIPPHTYLPQPDSDSSAHHSATSFFSSSKISAMITGAVLLMTFFGTYFVPAFVHICVHMFKRPLAIVVPPILTPLVHTPLVHAFLLLTRVQTKCMQ
ncbi:hypothetical protein D9619_013183 [Psilocybe cf. subviscida]|uniref:Uncharacterized protein n=1 Tax=Psilocybe cf. subviscida TaxID=2480587 RepID=A0A8H5EZ19_9AGAR|nr:hypothetical protein D9619_013183 [Psilocybe cf. subviscida]